MAGAVGVVLAGIVAFLTAGEKASGIGQRWLARGVSAGVSPLVDRVDNLDRRVEAHSEYTRHHLGPNGDSPRLHDRVDHIESQLAAIRREQMQVRSEYEDERREGG